MDIVDEADAYLANSTDEGNKDIADTEDKQALKIVDEKQAEKTVAGTSKMTKRAVVMDYPSDQSGPSRAGQESTTDHSGPVTRRELDKELKLLKAKEKQERRKEWKRQSSTLRTGAKIKLKDTW